MNVFGVRGQLQRVFQREPGCEFMTTIDLASRQQIQVILGEDSRLLQDCLALCPVCPYGLCEVPRRAKPRWAGPLWPSSLFAKSCCRGVVTFMRWIGCWAGDQDLNTTLTRFKRGWRFDNLGTLMPEMASIKDAMFGSRDVEQGKKINLFTLLFTQDRYIRELLMVSYGAVGLGGVYVGGSSDASACRVEDSLRSGIRKRELRGMALKVPRPLG
jgi:hypothetical protein